MVDVVRPILRNATNRINSSLLIGIAIGIVIGTVISTIHDHSSTLNDNVQQGTKIGLVKTLAETPVRNTVHVDELGRPITKQQLLEPFVIPNCVGFSVATFLPGQVMLPPHQHEFMHELFYVIEGNGFIKIGEKEISVASGTFLHIAPKEAHGVWVPKDSKEPLKMIVTGVTVGQK